MEIATIENEQIPSPAIYKHSPTHIFYMITSTICFIIEVYQRISKDLSYASYTNSNPYSLFLNRFPTDLTASYTSISYIWYLVFIWQTLWIIYSFSGLFRRTSSGFYFYQYPCVMNKWIYFYTTIALLLYISPFTSTADNIYFNVISSIRYVFTLCMVILIFLTVNKTLKDTMRDYLRNGYFLDIWLTRILYQNGLILWASILFYESCLSIIIGLMHFNFVSTQIACMIGTSMFLIGIILIFVYQYLDEENYNAFILLHWFVFLWLLIDISLTSKNKVKLSISNGMIMSLNNYFVIFFLVNRLRELYIACKENLCPGFHSRKVYSLIVPPRTF